MDTKTRISDFVYGITYGILGGVLIGWSLCLVFG